MLLIAYKKIKKTNHLLHKMKLNYTKMVSKSKVHLHRLTTHLIEDKFFQEIDLKINHFRDKELI